MTGKAEVTWFGVGKPRIGGKKERGLRVQSPNHEPGGGPYWKLKQSDKRRRHVGKKPHFLNSFLTRVQSTNQAPRGGLLQETQTGLHACKDLAFGWTKSRPNMADGNRRRRRWLDSQLAEVPNTTNCTSSLIPRVFHGSRRQRRGHFLFPFYLFPVPFPFDECVPFPFDECVPFPFDEGSISFSFLMSVIFPFDECSFFYECSISF